MTKFIVDETFGNTTNVQYCQQITHKVFKTALIC